MQKVLLLLVTLLTAAPFAEARDYITPKEAMKRFDACGKYLRMSPANQRKIAKKTDYSREEGIRMCRSVVSRGRKKTLEDAKEWNRWEAGEVRRRRGGGGGSGGGSYEAPYCGSSSSCGALEHCYWGRCESTSNRCISDSQCSGGNTCNSDGLCGR